MKPTFRAVNIALLSTSLASSVACGGAYAQKGTATPSEMPEVADESVAASGGAVPSPAPPRGDARAKTDASGSEKPSAGAELLAYEATVTLGVYRVGEAITGVVAISRALSGQIVLRNDDQVVFRVPRASFD